MKQHIIADRYAKGLLALFSLAEFKDLRNDIYFLLKDIEENSKLKPFLASPLIKATEKMKLFKEISATLHYGERWNSLLELLIKNNREIHIQTILEEIDKMILEQLSVCKVTIKVAHEIDDKLKADIEEKISESLHKKIIPTYVIDLSVGGGFIAETDSQIINASLKHNIERFTQNHN